jgi:UDPglucose 6-dehydrogenase
MRVTVLGAGYVGATSAAVLAYLGHEVTCVERDGARLESWRSGADPLREPGLADLLAQVDVRFERHASALSFADVVVVAVGTPMGEDGTPDLAQVDEAAEEIRALVRDDTVVLIRSTVPVGTCDRLQSDRLSRTRVVSNPEFLREGHALHDALFPDRIVAGGQEDAKPVVEELYRRIITGRDLPPRGRPARAVPVLWMSARSAELAKYAANGFLATKLSFVNEIANLAQAVGADAPSVLGSMGFDPRIGHQHLRPGLGWGGSCFPKDTRALQAIADGAGYDFVVLRAAIEQNTRQLCDFAAAIERAVPAGGRIGLLGLAFKNGTPDTRQSPAVALAKLLIRSGFKVNAYDPAVRALPDEPAVVVCKTVRDACSRADAIVIATEWPEFAELDLAAIRRLTGGDLLFDGRTLISSSKAAAAGFHYRGLGNFGGHQLPLSARRGPDRRSARRREVAADLGAGSRVRGAA